MFIAMFAGTVHDRPVIACKFVLAAIVKSVVTKNWLATPFTAYADPEIVPLTSNFPKVGVFPIPTLPPEVACKLKELASMVIGLV